MNYAQAKPLADALRTAMAPYCQWIEIAGSIRREKQEDIKDVEIVALPTWEVWPDLTDLFGERSILTNRLYRWATMGENTRCDVRWIKPGTSEIIPWEPNENGRYWRGLAQGKWGKTGTGEVVVQGGIKTENLRKKQVSSATVE